MGYSYKMKSNLIFEKFYIGWNYSIVLTPTDRYIIDILTINLSSVDNLNKKTLVKTLELFKNAENQFMGNFGILNTNKYIVDFKSVSIYGTIEIRSNVVEFSVGSN